MDGLPVKTSARLFRLSTYHQSVNGFSYTATPLCPLKCVNRQIRHGCQARVRKKLTMLHIHFPPPYNQLHTYDWGEIFSTLSWHAHTKNKLRFSPYPRTPHPTTHTPPRPRCLSQRQESTQEKGHAIPPNIETETAKEKS